MNKYSIISFYGIIINEILKLGGVLGECRQQGRPQTGIKSDHRGRNILFNCKILYP